MIPQNAKDDVTPIRIENRKYSGIQEIGFTIGPSGDEHFIINLHTTPPGPEGYPRGGYFTAIPISPLSYRVKHPTRAAYKRNSATEITLWDDHNTSHCIVSTNKIVDTLESECLMYNLPEKK